MSAGVLDRLRRPLRERAAERAARWEAPRGAAEARRARLRALLGNTLLALAVAASLATVVWRQTEGVERQRELTRLGEETAIAAAERAEMASRLQALGTRARITRVGRERLGLHVARDHEVVFLPVPAAALEEGP